MNFTTLKNLLSLESWYVVGSGVVVNQVAWPFFKLLSIIYLRVVIQAFLRRLTERWRKLTCSVWNISNLEGYLRSLVALQSSSSAIF